MFKKTRQSGAGQVPGGQDASVRISANASGQAEPSRVVPAYGRLGNAASAPAPQEEKGARLHVGEGLKLEGKVENCELLTIDGGVSADVESKDFKIGKTGKMTGDARVDTAYINGNFEGTLTVSDLLSVGPTGCIRGKIVYGALSVENGGRIIGEMILEEKEVPRVISGKAPFLTKSVSSGGVSRETRRRAIPPRPGGEKGKQP